MVGSNLRLKYPVNFVELPGSIFGGEAFLTWRGCVKTFYCELCRTGEGFGTSFDVSCYNDDEFGLATLASGRLR